MNNQSTSAATDISEFLCDLDGGQFERMLSVALSNVASKVVDNQKKGLVSVTFEVQPIKGTHQVHIEHTLKFSHPTTSGKAGEESTRGTPMHVGKFGKLSIAPENQMSFMDKKTGEITV